MAGTVESEDESSVTETASVSRIDESRGETESDGWEEA